MNISEFIKNNQNYFEDFISRSTFHSNAIEGNTLSYAETYAIIFNDNDFKVTAQPREIYEAINHKYAISYILEHLEQELSQQMIKDIGVLINRNVKDISGYRTQNVFIRGAEHIPPNAKDIPQAMMYYIYNYNKTRYNDIFEKIAYNHIDFERIHPLEDGNGRTGRLLINYELLRNNLPPLVILKDDRNEYFKYLENRDYQGLAKFLTVSHEVEKKRISKFIEMD
jgi:Uncharacterized conserved protein